MKIATTLATATLLVSMNALAEEPASFRDLDTDQNGTIDKQEAKAHAGLAANFEMADRDGNGKLDTQEFTYALARIQMEGKADQRS